MIVVAKIGTSSLTDAAGRIDTGAVAKLAGEVAELRSAGHPVIVVTSGAIAAGVEAMGLAERPGDLLSLQALSAVGQGRLMHAYDQALVTHGLVGAQVLLVPLDFVHRTQYLHARRTLLRLLDLGAVPLVNENDAIADDEIRYGDNDRLAALVAHLVGAEVLVLLTDTPGLLTGDPRSGEAVAYVAEINAFGPGLAGLAGGPGTERGSGGMASKLAAARMAAWSGVRAVIAAAHRPRVLADAVDGVDGVGTIVHPDGRRLPARKLWIAFAAETTGRVHVDAGARRALERDGSLLAAGVVRAEGDFEAEDVVEIVDPAGEVFARGLARLGAGTVALVAGRRSGELPADVDGVVVHRDDLVMVPEG